MLLCFRNNSMGYRLQNLISDVPHSISTGRMLWRKGCWNHQMGCWEFVLASCWLTGTNTEGHSSLLSKGSFMWGEHNGQTIWTHTCQVIWWWFANLIFSVWFIFFHYRLPSVFIAWQLSRDVHSPISPCILWAYH